MHEQCEKSAETDLVIRISKLPQAGNETFYDSSYFSRPGATLPSPSEVRHRTQSDPAAKNDSVTRPRPVKFPERQLLVKYGREISVAEGQCLWYIGRHLSDVPVPEIFGWRRDEGETFLYMSLVQGQTLEDRWDLLDESARDAVCKQLKIMVGSWRGLRQEQEQEPYAVGTMPVFT